MTLVYCVHTSHFWIGTESQTCSNSMSQSRIRPSLVSTAARCSVTGQQVPENTWQVLLILRGSEWQCSSYRIPRGTAASRGEVGILTGRIWSCWTRTLTQPFSCRQYRTSRCLQGITWRKEEEFLSRTTEPTACLDATSMMTISRG